MRSDDKFAIDDVSVLLPRWRFRLVLAWVDAGLAIEDFTGAFARGFSCGAITEEADEGRSQMTFGDAQRVMAAQAVGNGGEVGVVRADDDGDRELRRLKRIVAARRNEAATDEGNRSWRE